MADAGRGRFSTSLDDLERSSRVPVDEQTSEQTTRGPGWQMDPDELDRLQVTANPTSPGRLRRD